MAAECECKQEGKNAMLEERDKMIVESLSKQDMKLDMILSQVTKVAVLENNHQHHSSGLERAFKQIQKHEDELDSLSKEVKDFIAHTRGMARMAWDLRGFLSGTVGILGIKLVFGSLS